jgi:hypothetical protein
MAAVDLCSFNHVHKSTAAMNYFFSNMTNTVISMSLGDLRIRHTTVVAFSPLHIRVITKLPNSEQSYKGKVKTHTYINRQILSVYIRMSFDFPFVRLFGVR